MSSLRESREIKKRDQIEITLINTDNYLNVKPTLSQASWEAPRIELSKYLKPLGISQHIGRVDDIRPEIQEVIITADYGRSRTHYDGLILASGASLKLPKLPGIHLVFNLDTCSNARSLEKHIFDIARNDFNDNGASTFLVVGSGFTALQTVTAIEKKARTIQAYHTKKQTPFRIILLTVQDVDEEHLSETCIRYIRSILLSRNIEIVTKRRVTAVEPASVLLDNGTHIATRTVIWADDASASNLAECFNGPRDEMNRLKVDKFLKLPVYTEVLAAGGVANLGSLAPMATVSRYAQFEGRWAGHNAINSLFGQMKEYVPPLTDPCIDLGEPEDVRDSSEQQLKRGRDQQRTIERQLNTIYLYPWQDVEQTVKSSYPAFPRYFDRQYPIGN